MTVDNEKIILIQVLKFRWTPVGVYWKQYRLSTDYFWYMIKLEKIKILSLKQSTACYTKKNTDVPAKKKKDKDTQQNYHTRGEITLR